MERQGSWVQREPHQAGNRERSMSTSQKQEPPPAGAVATPEVALEAVHRVRSVDGARRLVRLQGRLHDSRVHLRGYAGTVLFVMVLAYVGMHLMGIRDEGDFDWTD